MRLHLRPPLARQANPRSRWPIMCLGMKACLCAGAISDQNASDHSKGHSRSRGVWHDGTEIPMTDPHDTPDLAGQLVRIHGSDNEDRLRNIYLDGWSQMNMVAAKARRELGADTDEYVSSRRAASRRSPALTMLVRSNTGVFGSPKGFCQARRRQSPLPSGHGTTPRARRCGETCSSCGPQRAACPRPGLAAAA